MVLEQESQLNAPDPRESNPPCYDDAIQMPRLDTSFLSLKPDMFASSDSVNSFRRATKRSRCRSVEVLSTGQHRRHILAARPRKNTSRAWQTNGTSNVDLTHNIATLPNGSSQKSFEIIAQLETEDGHSPYAKRRPQVTNAPVAQTDSSSESLNPQDFVNGNQQTVSNENYYSSDDNVDAGESSQASRSLFTSNEALDSTSTSTSSSSIDYKSYSRFSHHLHPSRNSEV